jgi:TPR repeat protein
MLRFEAPVPDGRDEEDIVDAAVRTLAEFFYECGFGTDRALDMAWHLYLIPDQHEDGF